MQLRQPRSGLPPRIVITVALATSTPNFDHRRKMTSTSISPSETLHHVLFRNPLFHPPVQIAPRDAL